MLLCIWMISWSWLTQNMQTKWHGLFCALYWFFLDYRLIFPSQSLVLLNILVLSGTMQAYIGYVCISVSWQILEIQQFTLSSLQMQPVTVSQVMLYWARSPFEPKDILNLVAVTCHSEWHVEGVPFSSRQCQLFQLQQRLVPLQFPLPEVVLLQMLHQITGPFIFMVLAYLYALGEPG